ncbi:MAG TPA: biotin/lipoyl-binding protein, partial [Thermoanaerobaculia bacterium]
MDRPVERPRGARQILILSAIAVAAAIVLALLFPAARRWWSADVAVDATSLRYAEVQRGDLNRDISVQARVVASLHPTLFSPAQGMVSLKTRAGAVVRKGDTLAVIDSNELRSSLDQARNSLSAARSDFDRQRIVARQGELRGRQQVDLLAVRLEAAKRQLERSERAFKEGIANKTDFEAAQDTVRITTMELQQARRELDLNRETLNFEVQNRQQQFLRQQSVADELQRQAEQLTIRAPFDGMVASVA